MTKQERRLHRQFDALAASIPGSRRALNRLLAPGRWPVRLPVVILLILGGVFSFLPVLGLWMLPLGLMLLAIDVPFLRPAITTASVRTRRFVRLRLRRRRRKRRASQASGGKSPSPRR